MSFDQIDNNTNESPPQSAASGSGGPHPTLIALAILGGLALAFGLQNRNPVKMHFLMFDWTHQVWSSILVAIAIGAALDRLFAIWWRRRRHKKKA